MRDDHRSSEGYARYVLGLLVAVYVLNFLDRQILSILAERIKADLNLTDAHIGFLYGTAFAVFYALFGIPLGRLADAWIRTRLIAVGLAFWSLMTAASAFARGFGQLTAARIGVGIGEASASPAAFSLLSDYFPPARRATVLAIYSSGIYIGAGLGLFIGGLIVDRWDAAYPIAAAAPLGLRGWQVAYLVVGVPGLPLALWVSTLREPRRGESERVAVDEAAAGHHTGGHGSDHARSARMHAGQSATRSAAGRSSAGTEARSASTGTEAGSASAGTEAGSYPFLEFARELRAVLPPFTLINLAMIGAGRGAIARNVVAAGGIAALTWLLIAVLGTPAQWIALGVGAYAAVSWSQSLARRDPAAFRMIFHTPTLRWTAVGFSLLAFTAYGIGFWAPPYFIRVRGVGESQVGLILGGGAAAAGWLGVTAGGLWADRWRRTHSAGRLYVGLAAAVLPLPFVIWMLNTPSVPLAFTLAILANAVTSLWIGPGASTIQDLIAPRARGTASAAYLLVVTFIGLALGPYTIGRLSVALGDLRLAMLLVLFANPVALLMLLLAARHVESDEARMRTAA